MELLLVRHALPVRREVEEGAADPELAEVGIAQADHLGRYLADERIDVIYSSPMRRARETATPIAAAQQREIVIADGVAEYDRNASWYVPVEELKATNDPRWQALQRGEWYAEESLPEFHARVGAAMEAIIAAHPNDKVAVVCHGGVINSYLAKVLGIPQKMGFFYPAYTGVSRVAASSEGRRSIISINDIGHLRGTGITAGLTLA
jgi:probable phosphoglycerate mutase